MDVHQVTEWDAKLGGLVVFRGILGNPLIEKFRALLSAAAGYDGRPAPLVAAASAFEAALLPIGEDWGAVLLDILLEDDNLCIRLGLRQTQREKRHRERSLER